MYVVSNRLVEQTQLSECVLSNCRAWANKVSMSPWLSSNAICPVWRFETATTELRDETSEEEASSTRISEALRLCNVNGK